MVLSASSHSHERLGHFPDGCQVLVPATNIPVASFRTMGFKATVALKGQGVELARAVVFAP